MESELLCCGRNYVTSCVSYQFLNFTVDKFIYPDEYISKVWQSLKLPKSMFFSALHW